MAAKYPNAGSPSDGSAPPTLESLESHLHPDFQDLESIVRQLAWGVYSSEKMGGGNLENNIAWLSLVQMAKNQKNSPLSKLTFQERLGTPPELEEIPSKADPKFYADLEAIVRQLAWCGYNAGVDPTNVGTYLLHNTAFQALAQMAKDERDGTLSRIEAPPKYVAGFVFNTACTDVVLIKKNKPEWQEGLWNAVGGKVETTDESPAHAMSREFLEETGVYLPVSGWKHFLTLQDIRGYSVAFFSCISSEAEHCRTNENNGEQVEIHCVEGLPRELIYNIPWLVWMAREAEVDRFDRYQVIEIKEGHDGN